MTTPVRKNRPQTPHPEDRRTEHPDPVCVSAAHDKALASETGYYNRATLLQEGQDRVETQDARRTRDELRAYERHAMSNTLAHITDPVILVEDTVELAEVIEATIYSMGLPIVTANHGTHGLELLQQQAASLLILDIGLPDISGWELLKTLKEQFLTEQRSLPPIIVITAYGDPANRLVGKLQEVSAYLIKPFTPDQIEMIVRDVLTGRSPANRGQ